MIRPIPFSHYSVSDKGDVLSRGKPMKLYTNKVGYKQVTLYFDGKAKLCMIHRLVATAFISNRKKKPLRAYDTDTTLSRDYPSHGR